MEIKKVPFFKRIKDAVINFDKYLGFCEEKLSIAIKYIIKLILIFTLVITIALTIKVVQEAKNVIARFQNEAPEFSFQNNELIIEGDNKKVVEGDESGYFGLIVDSQNGNLSDVQEARDYQRVIAILKDKISIKDAEGVEASLTYEELSQDYDLNSVNKESILQFLSGNSMIKIYAILAAIIFVYFFIAYIIQFCLDILLLSVVGYLLAKIIGVKFKYKSIFNMSVYAITLSIILYLIYMIVNLFTGFTIKYFEIAYNAISYIYIITAMLMIKSDLIKQQIEVGKIVEEQKKIREENKREQEEKDKKPKEDKKEKKEKKENNKEEGTPEGNQA